MGKLKPIISAAVPPALEAIIRLGGPTKMAKRLGAPISAGTVETWMRQRSIPMGWVRVVSKLSGVPLEEFYRFEEARARPQPVGGSVRRELQGIEN
jgi:hypothetical protein